MKISRHLFACLAVYAICIFSCHAEHVEKLPAWKKSLFSAKYCFIAKVDKHEKNGYNRFVPIEFFWGEKDDWLKHRLRIIDSPLFPEGSVFFIKFTFKKDGTYATHYSRVNERREIQKSKFKVDINGTKMSLEAFRELSLERRRVRE